MLSGEGVALMKPHSLETDYVAFCASLEARVNGLMALWPSVFGFWERWCKEHQITARTLSGRDFGAQMPSQTESFWPDLLRRRERMVSALSQGLRLDETDSIRFRQELNALLRDHDSGFVRLLQGELDSVREQMTHAFSVRKTVNAYAQTAQYRGE